MATGRGMPFVPRRLFREAWGRGLPLRGPGGGASGRPDSAMLNWREGGRAGKLLWPKRIGPRRRENVKGESPAPAALAPAIVGRARWIYGLSLTEIGLTLGTAAIVTWAGPANGPRCPSFPGCLAEPATAMAFVHQAAAGVLLVLAIVIAALAVPRGSRPAVALLPAALGLAALGLTAALGLLFASGVLALSWAPIQYLFLAMVVLLFAWTARDARRTRPVLSHDSAGSPASSWRPGG